MTSYTMDYALQQAADVVARDMSPARREAFRAGAAWFAQVFAEAGAQQSLGANVRTLVGQLTSARQSAEQTLSRLEGATFDPGDIDARGRTVLALTGALLKAFEGTLQPKDAVSGTRLRDERIGQQIARAVSYIVWAYLTQGAALPVADAPPGAEA